MFTGQKVDSLLYIQRNIKLSSQGIAGTDRNNSQGQATLNETCPHPGYSAVAAGGYKQIKILVQSRLRNVD